MHDNTKRIANQLPLRRREAVLEAEARWLSQQTCSYKLRGALWGKNSMGEMIAPMLPLKDDSVTAVEARRVSVQPCEVVRGRRRRPVSAMCSLESEGNDAVNRRRDCVDSLRTRSREKLRTF